MSAANITMQIKMKRTIRISAHLCAALFFTLGLTACRTVNTAEPAVPVAQRQMVNDKRIITDSDLDFNARVIGINQAAVGSGDLLKVQVEIQNNSRERKRFNYKFEWFDPNAMLIEAPVPVWMPREVEGKETIDITGVAPNPQAKDFRLKLIEN